MLTEEQTQIVEASPGHTVVYAAPGSGKTTVLTQHIVHQLQKNRCTPRGIMAMTFTRQASLEMKQRIRQSGIIQARAIEALNIGTFHAQLFKLLLHSNPDIPVLLSASEQYQMIKVCLERFSNRKSCVKKEQIQDFINQYSIHAAHYPPLSVSKKTAKIIAAYTKLKTQAGRWDFDDILQTFCQSLERNKGRFPGLKKIQYLLIDEFQDTNSVQWTIIQNLISYLEVPVFVVGDDDQSIYGFRGASPEFLLSFKKVYKNARVYTLTSNFRSVPQIVHHATMLIHWNQVRSQKQMKSARLDNGTAHAVVVSSEDKEACLVLCVLKEIKKSHPDWSCAILARTRRQLYTVWAKLSDSEISNTQLRTFHDAKGKEWNAVLIVGLIDKNPYLAKQPNTNEEIEEERRLYYVALTRAKDVSYTFMPKKSAGVNTKISRFSEEAALPQIKM